MADRACNRCIAKKRRCDHARPVCGTCKKLKLEGECAYPPPQARRGPVAGMSRRAEHRAQQCENALWFLLNLPGVQDAIERVDPDILNKPFVPAPTAKLERSQRSDWWGDHTMRQPADVFMFREACSRLETEADLHEQEQVPSASTEDGLEYEPAYDPSLEYDYDRSRSTPNPHLDSNHHHSRSNGVSHREDESVHASASTSHPPSRQRSAEPRRRDDSAMRNAMGPSLWQLVSAAIPDEDDLPERSDRSPPPGREWPPAPMWSAPPPQDREEYEGAKRKRRADIFW